MAHDPDCPRYGWADEPALTRHCTCCDHNDAVMRALDDGTEPPTYVYDCPHCGQTV
jgi:hypothetical protein